MSRCYICRGADEVEEWPPRSVPLGSPPNPKFCDECSLRVASMGILPASILYIGDVLAKILFELEHRK